MQPYLWLWLLLAPPILGLIDLMTSSATTSFGADRRRRVQNPDVQMT